MEARGIRPAPWPHVALAAVPGLLTAMGAAFPGMPIALFLVAIIGLALVGVALAARERSPAAFPGWALLPLGMALFGALMLAGSFAPGLEAPVWFALAAVVLLAAVARVLRRERPGRPPAASWALAAFGGGVYLLQSALVGNEGFGPNIADLALLALPLAAGLLLAPTHGLPAALVLLYFGAFRMSFEVEHVIYFHDLSGPGHPNAQIWSDAIKTAMPLLLLVLLPVWVLRARSLAGQAVALVAPVVAFYLVLVAGLSAASVIAADWNHVLRVARPVVRLLATLAACGAVFGWLRRGESGMEERESTGLAGDVAHEGAG